MVSLIDIGPDGGPYVAINENSNDLELQDINGNVIAKWDETAGQWDLNNNSLTGINSIDASSANVGSVDTEQANIGEGLQTVVNTTDLNNKIDDGVTLFLTESGTQYKVDDISSRVSLQGMGRGHIRSTTGTTQLATDNDDEITITERCGIRDVLLFDLIDAEPVSVDIDSNRVHIEGCGSGDVTVKDDQCYFSGNSGIDITFESGTAESVAVGNVDATITDNGDNEVFGNS